MRENSGGRIKNRALEMAPFVAAPLALAATAFAAGNADKEARVFSAKDGQERNGSIVVADHRTSPIAIRNSKECALIADKPSGYYVGTVCRGDEYYRIGKSSTGAYEFGMFRRKGRAMCGWIERDDFDPTSSAGKIARMACRRTLEERDNRYHFGEKFNCSDGGCVSGKHVKLTQRCDDKFYKNFSTAKESPLNPRKKNKSGFYDFVGNIKGDKVGYRLTVRGKSALGETAAVVAHKKYGWGFMRKRCIAGVPKGGARKYHDTVAGMNPNAKRLAHLKNR